MRDHPIYARRLTPTCYCRRSRALSEQGDLSWIFAARLAAHSPSVPPRRLLERQLEVLYSALTGDEDGSDLGQRACRVSITWGGRESRHGLDLNPGMDLPVALPPRASPLRNRRINANCGSGDDANKAPRSEMCFQSQGFPMAFPL
jgi:hypothetical protein